MAVHALTGERGRRLPTGRASGAMDAEKINLKYKVRFVLQSLM
jgi:hypothetical protein